ncbi:MAG: ABC transporter ATP-binding protein [Lachnospiraceae bacterium]|nr:ABC transporter ATP-binding protein [Lachnospiraceae bacterium]
MKEMIYLKDVCLSFGTGFSLDHLGFQVMAGEVYGFLGPSGAGKTTTMKLLTKQLNKSSGIIRVFGKDIEKMEREDFDQIGILSDTNGLYERMTIEENLQFFASLRQVPKKDVSRILHQIHLYDQKKTPLKKCSKGMKQRVVLAAAILHKPSLLFLDEPTSGLDPATIQAVHKMLMELNQEGTTIFLTTHNMEEADKLCGRIGILNQGSIIATGSPEDLKLHYAKEELLVTTADRQRITLPKTREGFKELLALSEEGNLLTVHSKEPNLEEIFLELTGREF